MNKYIFLSVFFIVDMAVAGQNSPFFDYLNSNVPAIDIDGDGVADLHRTFHKGRLIETVYTPTRQPNYKEITKHTGKDRFTQTVFVNDRKVATVNQIPTARGLKIETVEETSKTIVIMDAKNRVTENYTLKKGLWLFKDKKIEPIHTVIQASDAVNSTPGGTTSQAPSSLQEVEPAGFRIDSRSCNPADRVILSHATRKVANDLLPCLSRLNPQLGQSLLQNISTQKNLIRCSQPIPADARVAADQKIMAYTMPVPSAPISFAAGTPSARAELSEAQQITESASLIFHEALHNLGIPHNEDVANGRSNIADAVFGCQLHCTPELASSMPFIDKEQSCERCANQNTTLVRAAANALPRRPTNSCTRGTDI